MINLAYTNVGLCLVRLVSAFAFTFVCAVTVDFETA